MRLKYAGERARVVRRIFDLMPIKSGKGSARRSALGKALATETLRWVGGVPSGWGGMANAVMLLGRA